MPLHRAALAALALLGVLPFLQPWHRFPLTGFYAEWIALALGLVLLLPLLGRQAWGDAGLPRLALAPMALAFLLVGHGVLGWSPYFGQALAAALYLIWAGALVIATRLLVQDCGSDTVCAVLAAGLALGGALGAAIGVIQHFDVATPFNAWIDRPNGAVLAGNLGQTNHYASHVMLGLLSLAYLQVRGRVPGVVAVSLAAPMLLVLGLSGSRSVWLYLLAAFALAAWWRARSADPAARRLFFVTGLFILAYYGLQVWVEAGGLRPAQRGTLTAMERLFSGAASISDRISLWRAAWAMTLEHPLTGIGWGGFAQAYFAAVTAADPPGQYSLYHHAHNLVLHLLAETGLIGAALVVVPAGLCLYRVCRSTPSAQRWWWCALAAVLGLHSLLEYPLWYAYFLALAAVLAGLAPTPLFRPRLARLGRLLVLAVLLSGAVNLAMLWQDYRAFEGLLFTPGETAEAAVPAAEVSAVLGRLHRNPVLTPYVELASALPMSTDAARLADRLALNGQAMRFAPLATLVYREVLLLALDGQAAAAQALLVRARRAYPVPPPEFAADLERLAREQPARLRPLLESGLTPPRR